MTPLAPIRYRTYVTGLVAGSLAIGVYYAYAFWENYHSREIYPLLFAGMAVFAGYFLALIIRTRPYLFDPLLLLGGTLLVGVILKIPYLALNPKQKDYLFASHDVSIFAAGTYLILSAVASFLLGYALVTSGKFAKARTYRQQWNNLNMRLIAGCIVSMTLLAALLVMRELGFFNILAEPLKVRFLEFDDISSRLGTALYAYYKLALLAKIAAIVSFVFLLFKSGKYRLFMVVMLIISVAISILIPLIFSARATAGLLFVDFLVIAYFSGIHIKMRYLLAFLGIGFAIFAYATIQRSPTIEGIQGVLESVLAHQYLLELTKTARIVWYMDYADIRFYGETLIGWLFIPIPVSMLPYNPMFIDMGSWIGRYVYCWPIGGVPAGYIAELYMNFGRAGVIVGMLLMGIFIGCFWRWFVPRMQHPAVLVFGSMLLIRFGIFLFNNDLGTFVLKNLMETLPTVLAVYACVSVRSSCGREPAPNGASRWSLRHLLLSANR